MPPSPSRVSSGSRRPRSARAAPAGRDVVTQRDYPRTALSRATPGVARCRRTPPAEPRRRTASRSSEQDGEQAARVVDAASSEAAGPQTSTRSATPTDSRPTRQRRSTRSGVSRALWSTSGQPSGAAVRRCARGDRRPSRRSSMSSRLAPSRASTATSPPRRGVGAPSSGTTVPDRHGRHPERDRCTPARRRRSCWPSTSAPDPSTRARSRRPPTGCDVVDGRRIVVGRTHAEIGGSVADPRLPWPSSPSRDHPTPRGAVDRARPSASPAPRRSRHRQGPTDDEPSER